MRQGLMDADCFILSYNDDRRNKGPRNNNNDDRRNKGLRCNAPAAPPATFSSHARRFQDGLRQRW